MAGSFIADDFETLFAASDFGVAEGSALYKGAAVSGIFDDEDVEVQTGEGEASIMPQTTFTTSTSQVPLDGLAEGDPMVVDGTNYQVKNWKHDGTGELILYLRLVD